MNGIVKFNISKVEHTLLFGMKAVLIYGQKYANELDRNPDKDSVIDNFKLFSYIIYAGMCNLAESRDLEYPKFEEAYSLTEEINNFPEIVIKISQAFQDSRATKKVVDALVPVKKKAVKPKATL